jgi:peptidoglycan/LPS O-acetylase OafA/YrhL
MYMLNTLTLDGLHPVLTRIGVTHPAATFVPFLIATVAVATLSYQYLESPFLKLKDRFNRISVPAHRVEVAPAPAKSLEVV